jgi:hypothetical protein
LAPTAAFGGQDMNSNPELSQLAPFPLSRYKNNMNSNQQAQTDW